MHVLLHLYSHGNDISDLKVTLKDAFQLLLEQDDETKDEDSFIGFTHPNNKNAIIQFIRNSETSWTIDIPMFEDDEYIGSLTSKLVHDDVFSLVMDFFNANSSFHKYILEENYQSIIKECKIKWGITLEEINE